MTPDPPAHASHAYKIVRVTPPIKVNQASVSYPLRLKIPKINVDAAIDYVGLTSTGNLGVPHGPDNAAWYDKGPIPGNPGNAVIDGHFGYKDNIPAVFDNLHDLVAGDNIFVQDDKGVTTAFVVSAVHTFGENDNDASIFRSTDSKAHLNLITCDGIWDEATQNYSDRLVVFADKI